MALSFDFTHVDGRNDWRQWDINPIEGAWDANAASYNTCGAVGAYRRLQCQFQQVLGDPRVLGSISAVHSNNEWRYDELIVHLESRYPRATFQASYTLSGAYAYGGAAAGAPVTDLGQVSQVAADLPLVPGKQDRLDVPEVLVQGRAPDAGLLGDLRHRHRPQPVPGDEGRRRVQDRVAHLAAVRLDRLVPQPRHPPKCTQRL